MRGKKNSSVVINGRQYDALTGLPVVKNPDQKAPAVLGVPAKPALAARQPHANQSAVRVMSDITPARTGPVPSPGEQPAVPTPPKPAATSRTAPHHVAQQVHRTPQRSQTLNRAAIKKPDITPVHASRSAMISKFAPHPKPLRQNVEQVTGPTAPQQQIGDIQAPRQPEVQTRPAPQPQPRQAPEVPPAPMPRQQSNPPPAQLSSRELKEQLIKERLAEVGQNDKEAAGKQSRIRGFLAQFKKPQLKHVAVATLAVLILGGYFAYLNMPSLSVRVAASRAGVSASYPEYRPDGYSFSGPVSYAAGEVSLEFASNTNEHIYTVTQRASNWDSQAVLDNFVTQKSDSYLTYSEQGLTIYTFENKAAWVNRGVFYTIDGDAPLSSEQILRIAASL